MPKRKQDTIDKIEKKIKRYQEKIEKIRWKTKPPSASPPRRGNLSDPEQEQPPVSPVAESPPPLEEAAGELPAVSQPENITNNAENQDVELDEEILTLLGDAPQETKFGPPIHKDLAIRWADIIKNGLTKEKRSELKKTYLTPENCKTLEAPKLNLEAQAAVAEQAAKRDKAIMAKQNQIGSALTALAVAFGKLCKSKENLSIINNISDAARLLCDHQHQESTTRRNFILQGLEQSTRDSVKDTEVDQWLFGENFAEKLKASKAIKKSGQEISVNKTKKTAQQPKKPLNTKGPVINQLKSRVYRTGPHQAYQSYRKPVPPAPLKSQGYNQPQNKTLQRPVNNSRNY